MPRRMKGSIGKDLVAVRHSLRALDRSLARLVELLLARNEGGKPGPRARPRPKLKFSPARLKGLKLHGRYIGYLRHLKPRQKAEVRALRARKGVKAAIKRARKLAGK
jgi:hypothetical protein